MIKEAISKNAILRLSLYLTHLKRIDREKRITSDQFADQLGISDVRIRKDFSYLGRFGIPRKGYRVDKLQEQISKALGLDRVWSVALVGMGTLGRFVLNSPALKKSVFSVRVGFDVDPKKTSRKIDSVNVYHLYEMPRIIRKEKIKIGIIATSTEAAQESADLLILSGIKAILNLSHIGVVVPSYVKLQNANFISQLEIMPYHILNS